MERTYMVRSTKLKHEIVNNEAFHELTRFEDDLQTEGAEDAGGNS